MERGFVFSDVGQFLKEYLCVIEQLFLPVRVGLPVVPDGLDEVVFLFCDLFYHIRDYFKLDDAKIVQNFVLSKLLV